MTAVVDRLLRRLKGGRASAVTGGLRVYAVGDIHGRADCLGRLATLVARDLALHPVARQLTVFLGDYMDRGPDSAGVVDRLARRDFPTPMVALRGNHDAIFLDLLAGKTDLRYYEQLGGGATLASYGIDLEDLQRRSADHRTRVLGAAVPRDHLAFLEATPFAIEVGDYFFCHAGARPGIPLTSQDPDDLIWIREDFLRSRHDFGKIIVHGHTPVLAPDVRVNGINVDTKAFATGILTALVLEGTDRRFLQTSGDGR